MKRTLFLIITVALSSQIFSQQDYNKLITDFFETYAKDKEKALDDIFATNEWLAKNEDGIKSIKSKLDMNVELMGEYQGYERIVTRTLGESLVLESYLVKYSRQPLRFTFMFYHPKDKWILHNFQFDDNFDEELEESAKVYMLNHY